MNVLIFQLHINTLLVEDAARTITDKFFKLKWEVKIKVINKSYDNVSKL